jgi:hypothetical protein
MLLRLDPNSLRIINTIVKSATASKNGGEPKKSVNWLDISEKIGLLAVGAMLTLFGSLTTSWIEANRREAESRQTMLVDVSKRDEAALASEISADVDLLTAISSSSREELVWLEEYWTKGLDFLSRWKFHGAMYDPNKRTVVLPVELKDLNLRANVRAADDVALRLRMSFAVADAGHESLEKRRGEWIRNQIVRQLRLEWSFGQGAAFSAGISHPIRRLQFNLKNIYKWSVSTERDETKVEIIEQSGDNPAGDGGTTVSDHARLTEIFWSQFRFAQNGLTTMTNDIDKVIRAKRQKLDEVRRVPLQGTGARR